MLSPRPNADPYDWPFDGRWSAADTALVIIDMQTDFLKPGGYCDQMGLDIGLTSAAIEPTRRVLARMRETRLHHHSHPARAIGRDLSPTSTTTNAGAPPGSARRSVATGPCGRVLMRGEPGWDIVPELYPQAGEPIVDKPGKGAFHATDFELILARRRVPQSGVHRRHQ